MGNRMQRTVGLYIGPSLAHIRSFSDAILPSCINPSLQLRSAAD